MDSACHEKLKAEKALGHVIYGGLDATFIHLIYDPPMSPIKVSIM